MDTVYLNRIKAVNSISKAVKIQLLSNIPLSGKQGFLNSPQGDFTEAEAIERHHHRDYQSLDSISNL